MNAKQFKDLVRTIVREEIEQILPQILSEMKVTNPTKPISKKPVSTENFFEELQKEVFGVSSEPTKAPTPKEFKKYTNNEKLNKALNETIGGVLPDPTSTGLPSTLNFKQPAKSLNIKQTEQVAPVASNPALLESTKAQMELGVFKDYRKLMKAIDTKKKQGSTGARSLGLSFDDGPTDFTPIDE